MVSHSYGEYITLADGRNVYFTDMDITYTREGPLGVSCNLYVMLPDHLSHLVDWVQSFSNLNADSFDLLTKQLPKFTLESLKQVWDDEEALVLALETVADGTPVEWAVSFASAPTV